MDCRTAQPGPLALGSGRLVFRALVEQGLLGTQLDVVAVGDIVPADNLAYLLKYDSSQGRFSGTVGSKKSSPDKLEDDEGEAASPWGVLLTTVVVFFLAEMGDKTQIATVMLAARYEAYVSVIAGTTLGMMLANAPVVWFGERITRKLPITLVHRVSALVFVGLGIAALFMPR